MYVFLIVAANNGKTSFAEEIKKIMGDYGERLSSNVLTSENPDRVALARLHKKRFVMVEEPPKNSVLNGDRIKEITGMHLTFAVFQSF